MQVRISIENVCSKKDPYIGKQSVGEEGYLTLMASKNQISGDITGILSTSREFIDHSPKGYGQFFVAYHTGPISIGDDDLMELAELLGPIVSSIVYNLHHNHSADSFQSDVKRKFEKFVRKLNDEEFLKKRTTSGSIIGCYYLNDSNPSSMKIRKI